MTYGSVDANTAQMRLATLKVLVGGPLHVPAIALAIGATESQTNNWCRWLAARGHLTIECDKDRPTVGCDLARWRKSGLFCTINPSGEELSAHLEPPYELYPLRGKRGTKKVEKTVKKREPRPKPVSMSMQLGPVAEILREWRGKRKWRRKRKAKAGTRGALDQAMKEQAGDDRASTRLAR
jgi:hypothetical protein